jgi:hypothetical protein
VLLAGVSARLAGDAQLSPSAKTGPVGFFDSHLYAEYTLVPVVLHENLHIRVDDPDLLPRLSGRR